MPEFYLHSLALALGVVAFYCIGLFLGYIDKTPMHIMGKSMPIVFVLGVIVAHFSWAAPGWASLLALPLGWVLALGPHYILTYHIVQPGRFGPQFNFLILGLFYLAPPFVLSLLLSLVTWLRR